MDASSLKENFTDQLKTVEQQIKQLETDLEKAKEYKIKLLGGLETIQILYPDSPETEEDNTLKE